MWRTLIVQAGEKITLQNNWLYVYSEEHEARVPVGDLYSVVIDNRRAMLSVAFIFYFVTRAMCPPLNCFP